MNLRQILLHLSLIKNIGPGLVARLIQAVGVQHLAQLYSFSEFAFIARANFTPAQAHAICAGLSNKDCLDKELECIEKHSIHWLTCIDQAYPSLLKEIYSPPTILYYQGAKPFECESALAIVGSRKAYHYARAIINRLVPDLVACNWTIVSGGALGADSLAHEATLAVKGRTIAVLGSGLLRPYPLSNRRLFARIIDAGGFVVSSFPLQMEALPGNFPARNRIISGLYRGCLVVQAAESSGAKITAQFALDQSREVFAIPGSLDDPLSAGCHQLIQQGAKLVCNASDIVSEFGQSFESKVESISAIQREAFCLKIPEDDSVQGRILRFCSKPMSIDQMMAHVDLELSHVQAVVFELQLDDKIAQNSAGLWISS